MTFVLRQIGPPSRHICRKHKPILQLDFFLECFNSLISFISEDTLSAVENLLVTINSRGQENGRDEKARVLWLLDLCVGPGEMTETAESIVAHCCLPLCTQSSL